MATGAAHIYIPLWGMEASIVRDNHTLVPVASFANKLPCLEKDS